MKVAWRWVAFGVCHFVASFWSSIALVVNVEGLALGARTPLLGAWEVISLILGLPVVTACIFVPAFPWKSLWAVIPFILNSCLWVWAGRSISRSRRHRLAGAA